MKDREIVVVKYGGSLVDDKAAEKKNTKKYKKVCREE